MNVSFHGGTLTVEHHDQNPMSWLKRIGSFGHQHIVLSIAVPAGTPVRASTVSGEGLISGTSGNSELKTVSGSVMADGTSGLLTTDTVSGEIIVRDHRGPFVAKSVGGEITASGELLNVRAKTISGDLSFDFQGSPNDLAMSSVSGDVTVRLPAEVGVALNVKSVSGRIIVDDQKYSGTNQRVETITGAEDRQLRLNGNSVSGNISIIHQVPAR
nr:DUF4097 family beta strand repeat-containing protein [Psychromicrobium silvestre]